jgi:hypothetical protein
MTTSLSELLGLVRQLQRLDQVRPRDPQLAWAARQTIGAAASGLRHLIVRQWQPDWSPERPGRQLTAALQQACFTVQAGNPGGPLAHPALLMATASDAVGVICGHATPAADRWVVTLALARVVRASAAAYTAHGPSLGDSHIDAARAAAVAVTQAGRRLLTGTTPRILDLPIPGPAISAPDTLGRAVAAAAAIEHILAASAVDHTRPAVTVYELRALAAAFQAVAQLAGAELGTDSGPAERAWARVRQFARSITDGARPDPDDPERLLRGAAQLHDDLEAAADTSHGDPRWAATLHEVTTNVVGSAGHLTAHAYRMAGRVYARADHLPPNDSRVTQRLRRQPIVLNANDLQPLADTLTAAEAASTALTQPSPTPNPGIGDYPIMNSEPLPVPRGASIDPPTL